MKRLIAMLLSAAMLTALVLTGCGSADSGSSQPVQAPTSEPSASAENPTVVKASDSSEATSGGWAVNAVADSLVTEQQGAIFEDSINSFDDLKMTPIAVLGQQVVAGTNYAFLCLDSTTSEFPKFSWDVSVVYQDLYGKSKLTSIIEINPANIHTVEKAGEEMVGAWETVAVTKEATLPDDVKAALDSVMTKEYVPIALLASQVVAGANYSVMVQEKADDQVANYIVQIYVDTEGNAELTCEEIFDLNYYLNVNN